MTEPTISVLPLGAGVQSTTLALLAIEGVLPRPAAAIFADTGWEPRTVYEHLDRSVELDRAEIPLHRVSQGNLRADAINPSHRYASVPYLVRNPPFDAAFDDWDYQPHWPTEAAALADLADAGWQVTGPGLMCRRCAAALACHTSGREFSSCQACLCEQSIPDHSVDRDGSCRVQCRWCDGES